jgi:hypothetical protein
MRMAEIARWTCFCAGSEYRWSARVLARLPDGGGHGLGGVCLQDPGARVIGEGDLPGTQVADHVFSVTGRGTSALRRLRRLMCLAADFRFGQEDVPGGQVRQDAVLDGVQVLRPGRAGLSRDPVWSFPAVMRLRAVVATRVLARGVVVARPAASIRRAFRDPAEVSTHASPPGS